MRHALSLILTLILLPALAPAQEQSPPPDEPEADQTSAPEPCSSPEHRQFDFWIGEWEVEDAKTGEIAGTNRIERILDGCVLRESWEGQSGLRGHSFNTWFEAGDRWHQTWVDNRGGLLELDGGLVGDSMVLEGSEPSRRDPSVTVRHRITWTPREDGTVRQHWQASKDGGETWDTVFDGLYRRRAP